MLHTTKSANHLSRRELVVIGSHIPTLRRFGAIRLANMISSINFMSGLVSSLITTSSPFWWKLMVTSTNINTFLNSRKVIIIFIDSVYPQKISHLLYVFELMMWSNTDLLLIFVCWIIDTVDDICISGCDLWWLISFNNGLCLVAFFYFDGEVAMYFV